MKNYKKIILSTLLIIFSIFVFSAVYAQETAPTPNAFNSARGKLDIIGGITGFGTTDKTGDVGIYDKIASIINILLGFVGIVAVIYIIFAGFKWMTAEGNEEQIKQAKATIKNAVIGLGIVFLAFVIINFITKSLIDVVKNNETTESTTRPCEWTYDGINFCKEKTKVQCDILGATWNSSCTLN